jgi:AraC-like DNA-binding protein
VTEVNGVGQRTLQRTLRDRGYCFSVALARARLSLARRLLGEPSIQVIGVAFELGYSDHAHFTSVFRRWTGLSPRRFRETLRSRAPSFEPAQAMRAERHAVREHGLLNWREESF